MQPLKDAAALHINTEAHAIINSFDQQVAAALQDVQVLVSTADAADKLLVNPYTGNAFSSRSDGNII